MPYDRVFFYTTVRKDLFGGILVQGQVDGMNHLLDEWEKYFEEPNPRDGTMWLAYALATFFHETGQRMLPVEEYGRGAGKPYGQPAGPHGQRYYGRGHVQLTWEANYKKGQDYLRNRYGVTSAIWPDANQMLQSDVSALVSFDGMVYGWFTGVGLSKYFNAMSIPPTEDPVNARRIVNGLDRASQIAGYYWKFKGALKKVAAPVLVADAELPGLPDGPAMPEPIKEV